MSRCKPARRSRGASLGTGRRQQTPGPTDKERRSRKKKGNKNSPPTAFGRRLNHADVATSSRPSGSAAWMTRVTTPLSCVEREGAWSKNAEQWWMCWCRLPVLVRTVSLVTKTLVQPWKQNIRPSFRVVFELFQLPRHHLHHDNHHQISQIDHVTSQEDSFIKNHFCYIYSSLFLLEKIKKKSIFQTFHIIIFVILIIRMDKVRIFFLTVFPVNTVWKSWICSCSFLKTELASTNHNHLPEQVFDCPWRHSRK